MSDFHPGYILNAIVYAVLGILFSVLRSLSSTR